MSISDCNGHIGSVLVMLNMCDSYKVDFGDKVCRSCLTNAEDMKSLNDLYSEEMCVFDVFTCITSLQCSANNDVLPTQICHECFGKLHSSYQFVLKSRESDKKLQAYLNKIHKTEEKFVAGNIRNISGITITDGRRSVKSENITHFSATTLLKTGHNLNVLIEDKTELNNFSNDLTEDEIIAEGYQSNDNIYEHSYEPIISLKTPLSIAEMQKDLDQELDLIKHEIDTVIKTDISNDINYKNSIAINNEPVNEQDIAISSESNLQSNQIANIITSDGNNEMENELNDSLITFDANKSTVFNRSNAETSNDIRRPSKQSLLNEPGHLLNSVNPYVVLERLNMNFVSTNVRTHNQCKQTNIVTATEINKKYAANIEMSSSDHEQVQVLPKTRRNPKIQDETKNVCIESAERPYLCTFCKNSFSGKVELMKHRRMHIKEYTCAVCNKSFSRKKQLVNHKRTHMKEKPYSCTACSKSFSLKANLVRHVRTHTGEKPYSCTICKKNFSTKSSSVDHARTHSREKPYLCTACNKSFSLKTNLVRHSRTHTGEQPYSCTACNKSFTRKAYLVIHVRTHTGEKPYLCTVCNKSFNRKSTLICHSRIHTGQKPYSCTVCSRSFIMKTHLVHHVRTHTGEQPYSCTVCKIYYSHKSSLNRHLRSHKAVE